MTQFMIKLPVFKEKKCYYLYNKFVYLNCTASQTPQLYLEKNQLVSQRLILLGLFLMRKNIFSNFDQLRFFLLLG